MKRPSGRTRRAPTVLDRYRRVHRRMRERHGLTVRALWGSEASQQARFGALARLFEGELGFSVLDLGCGFADFYAFLQQRGHHGVRYCGADIDADFVAEARRRHPAIEALVGSADEVAASGQSFDYVVASGIYNLGATGREPRDLFRRQFQLLWPLVRTGFAVNFLSSQSDHPDGKSIYHDAPQILGLCLRHFGRRVVLDHTYLPHDFTVRVYK